MALPTCPCISAIETRPKKTINTVTSDRVAPAFGRDGGGLQVRFFGKVPQIGKVTILSVKDMVQREYLR